MSTTVRVRRQCLLLLPRPVIYILSRALSLVLPVMLVLSAYTVPIPPSGPEDYAFTMAEGAMTSLPATLPSQTLSLGESSTNPPPPQPPPPDILAHQPQLPPSTGPSDTNASIDSPTKRRPGRPKGSGKKSIDLGTQIMKPKRPVGRPRKDGLPPGSVVERKQRPRKRPPGTFATISGTNGQSQGIIPYGVSVVTRVFSDTILTFGSGPSIRTVARIRLNASYALYERPGTAATADDVPHGPQP